LLNHTTPSSHTSSQTTKVKVYLIMATFGELHDQLMDLETAAVMKERVASSTRKGYESRNVAFMIWLFDNEQYHNLLEPHIFSEMVEAENKDCNTLTKKHTHSKKRFFLRAVCRLALTSMNPGVLTTIPIKLDNFHQVLIYF
jgi:hypothetical protein